MAIEQAALKAAIKSALDDMFDTKLAFLLNMKLEPSRSLMDFISNGFDEAKKKIAALENANAELAKGNQFLRQENARLSNALNQMKSAYEQEQYTLGVIAWKSEEFPLLRVKLQMKLLKKSAPSLMFVLKIQISQYPRELKAIVRFLP